jgi:hypothetical protein
LFVKFLNKGLAYGRKGVARIVNLIENVDSTDLVPSEFSLGQNYPNPFFDTTRIKFCVAHKTNVKLQVFDSEGRMAKTLLDEEKEAGTYEVEFSVGGRHPANLPGGAPGPSQGIYVYQLQAGGFTETKQMTVIDPP